MKNIILMMLALMTCCEMSAKGKRKAAGDWVATWATATEFTGKGDMPKSGTLTGSRYARL